MTRKTFNKKELLLLAPLLLFALAVYLFLTFSPKGQTAVIEVNGEVYREIRLADLSQPETFEVEGDLTVTVAVGPDWAEITDSPCPDRLCVRQGKITKSGESAVCLPARVSVRLTGSGGADGVTY